MFTEAYIEALLVDEEAADQVWELWDVGLTSSESATLAWLLIAERGQTAKLCETKRTNRGIS